MKQKKPKTQAAAPHRKPKKPKRLLAPWDKRRTVQSSIPYETMYDDGICYLGKSHYSLTFAVQDTNYVNVPEALQVGILEKYCKFLMALDNHSQLQIHVLSKPLARSTVHLQLPVREGVTELQKQCITEYNDTIVGRLTGSNAYIQEKYMTFTVVEPDYIQAKKHFERIDRDALSLLRAIGCQTRQMEKIPHLYLLREVYRPNDHSEISWLQMARTGIYDKDIIAPNTFETAVLKEHYIKLGDYYTRTLFLADFPQDISDGLIQQIVSLDEDILITINVQPQEPQYAVQQLRRRLRTLDIEKANSLSRQSKAGVLIPEVSRDLQNALKAVETFLESLRTRDEKMVLANFLIYIRGKTPEEVDAVMKSVQDRVAAAGCSARPFRFDHENGLNSVVPLGRNDCFVSRTFTTSSIAAFVPFNVVEIVQDNGFSYGRNGRSNNVLTLNRKNYTNAHGFYFGTSGSGKSMGAKAEIWECYWRTGDKILIIDPDGEFIPLVEMMGGEVVDLSNSSTSHFNPFDINEYYGGDEDPNPIPLKSDFIISLIEITLNYHDGLDPITKSIIDKCVREIYQPYLSKPKPQNIPTFEDFYEALLRQESQEAQDLARALEIYVHGSLNLFNGRTNVDTENRVLCFSTRNLGKQLRVMGMSIIQDFCWNLISRNQAEKKTTWLWNDEIHHSLRNPTTAEWLMNSWKRGRKYGLIATGMTQEVRDVCRTEESKALIANSEFIMIYREKPDMIEDLSQVISLSEQQENFLLTCEPGTGLFKAGNNIVEFSNRFPRTGELYRLFSTTVGRNDTDA